MITLQFGPSTDYFLGMRKRGKPRSEGGGNGGLAVLFPLLAGAMVGGCSERDRLTFPSDPGPGDGIGPVTMIDQPLGADTIVPAGPGVFVNGRTIDSSGVDTVYFLVIGGSDNFSPFRPNPPSDTVRWGLPITTINNDGDTIVVRVFGVDGQGNHGSIASRRIIVE
jgi:hypothetical protein